ncbi:MAG: hypothetical protein AAF702_39170 [Chloroflexota bacterium]
MTELTLDQKKQFIARHINETINKQNLDAIDHLVAEDFVEHVPLPGQEQGAEGLKQII